MWLSGWTRVGRRQIRLLSDCFLNPYTPFSSSSYASNESSSILLSATAERSTDVSMEDQDLFSLESCTPGESGQTDRLLMSPCSTTSRSPPSPLLGMTPKRQVGTFEVF